MVNTIAMQMLHWGKYTQSKYKTKNFYLMSSNWTLQSVMFRRQNVQSIFKNSSLLNFLFKSKMAHLKTTANED